MEVVLVDNTRIEKKAVSVINELFLDRAKQIDPNVTTGDKGISFDGSAVIFSDDQITKSSYLSSIPVQVKGKEVDTFSDKIAKFYKFDRDTFKNFQYEDGVVVFLVEILKENFQETKVFFGFLDAKLLENILNDLNDSDNNTRFIELDELSPTLDLDEKFREIAIQRKVYGFKDAKVDAFLKNGFSVEKFPNSFEKSVVESASKNIEQYEYKNPNSQFNIKLKKNMSKVLSQNLILDTFRLSSVYAKIKRLNLIDLLPENNKNLAMLIKARYKAMSRDFDSARAVLTEFSDSTNEWQKEYDKILIESNYDIDDIAPLINKSILSDDERVKYLAAYYLENNKLSQFYELLSSDSAEDEEWQYLHGQYLLRLGSYKKAIEVLRQLNQSQYMIGIKFDELDARFAYIANDLFFGFRNRTESVNNELAFLLDDIEVVRQRVAKVDYIEVPVLERLHFESKILFEPKEGLKRIDQLLRNKGSDYDTQYLIEWKIKMLFLLDKTDNALNYINQLSKKQISAQVIMFKILLFSKQSAHRFALDYISELFETLEVSGNEHLFGFLTQSYLVAANNYYVVDENTFDTTISNLMDKYRLELPLLFELENSRKHLGNKRYGESFGLIVDRFADYPDSEKIQNTQAFLLRNNELGLAQQLYPAIAAIDQQTADEIVATLYLQNNKNSESLAAISKYSDSDLSESIIAIKAEALNRLNQFRATLQLYKNTKGTTSNFLNQVLIAKINIHDKEDIESIIETGMESNNIYFKLNAAVALIRYGIDLPQGVQMIEKYILKERFNNSELNNILITSHFSNVKKFENNNFLDLYNNIQLKWYKFKEAEDLREFVLVPKGWNLEDFDNLEFQETDSNFSLIVQGISVGDSVNFENSEYTLIEEKPLSLFVFHESLERESGEIGSGKPITSIRLNLEDNDLSSLIEVMKKFDQSDKYNKIHDYYKQFHFPSIYSKIISKEDMFEFYLDFFNDKNIEYYVGSEVEYNSNSNYQMSVSSIAFLASLSLLDILEEYQNVFLEETQKAWLENRFSKELESTTAGRLNLVDEDNLVLNEKTEEQKRELKDIYRKVVLSSRSLKSTSVGLIDDKVNKLLQFDESSNQAAINEKRILLCEDEALQVVWKIEVGLQVSSVGILISHYFLEIEKNADGFLDVLIQVIELKSAWKLQMSTLKKMSVLIMESQNASLMSKFNTWFNSYVEYFKI